MQALTVEYISQLPVMNDVNVAPSAIAYIQQLTLPYAQAVEGATDAQGILSWIPQVFTGDLAQLLSDAFNEQLKDEVPTPEQVVDGLTAMIGYLVTHVIVLGMNVPNEEAITLYPWDIQLGISLQEEVARLFGIQPGDNVLPVGIAIGPNGFTHMLTKEFAAGLCLFSLLEVGDLRYRIAMFEVDIVPDDMLIASGFYRDPSGKQKLIKFKVVVSDKTYGFNTPDFMQGFSTGAMWANVDHHLYWKDLFEIERKGDKVEEFPITF